MEVLKKINLASFFILPVVLVLKDSIIAPFIAVFILSILPYFSRPTFQRSHFPVYFLILLYVLYLIGLFPSENMHYGLKDIETKMSFLLFPVVFIFSYKKIPKVSASWAKYGLIFGVSVSIIISILRAFLCTLDFGEYCYRSDNFGYNMHGTYLTSLCLLAVVFVLEKKAENDWMKYFKAIFVLAVLVECYFVKSLSAYLVIFLLAFLYFVYWTIETRRKKLLFIFPILVIGAIFVANTLPAVKKEVNNTVVKLSDFLTDNEKFLRQNSNVNESNTVRLVTYSLSSKLIVEHPFGVGTGDVKDELMEAYIENDFYKYAQLRYNSHNTFLQTGISIGWAGIIALLFVLVIPFFTKYVLQHKTLFFFLLIVFISSLFESFLERQVGVILLSFFLIILFISFKQESSIQKK